MGLSWEKSVIGPRSPRLQDGFQEKTRKGCRMTVIRGCGSGKGPRRETGKGGEESSISWIRRNTFPHPSRVTHWKALPWVGKKLFPPRKRRPASDEFERGDINKGTHSSRRTSNHARFNPKRQANPQDKKKTMIGIGNSHGHD